MRKGILFSRDAHIHHYSPFGLACPDIIQAHRPVVANTGQDARFGLVEFHFGDRLERGAELQV